MSSPVGFWSYARSDDAHSDGQLSQLRTIVGKAIALQYGADIIIWQDIQAIPPGADWAASIERTISQTVFFIPIVTPRYLKSTHCFAEFHSFRNRMSDLGHDDLIFPILYVGVDHIDGDETVFGDELQALRRHQWIDFRPFRHADPRSHEVGMWVDGLAENILKVAVPVSKAEHVADKSRQMLAAVADAARGREAPGKTVDGGHARDAPDAPTQEAQREQAKKLIDEARQRSAEGKAAQAVPAPLSTGPSASASPSASVQNASGAAAASIPTGTHAGFAGAASADSFLQRPVEPPVAVPMPVPPAKPRIALWAAAACGLIVVAGGAAMMFRQHEPPPAPPAPAPAPVIAPSPAPPVIASAPAPTPAPTPAPAPAPATPPPSAATTVPPRAPDLQGSVDQMLDSGALIVAGKIVNLDGVRGQGGRVASSMQHYLESQGNVVQCFSHDEAYQCFAHGQDVGLHALRQGWARARPGASPQYADAEASARSARAGIWGH